MVSGGGEVGHMNPMTRLTADGEVTVEVSAAIVAELRWSMVGDKGGEVGPKE